MMPRTLPAIALALVVLGAGVVAGWVVESTRLVRILPGFPPMVVETAACFILAGATLLASARNPLRMRVAMALGGSAILAIALLTLVENLFRAEIALNFAPLEAWAYDVSDETGRMSGATGAALLLAGVAMLLLPRARTPWAQVGVKLMGLAIGAMAVLALMGHAVGAPLLFPRYLFAGTAIHTAFGLLLLAFGLRELWRRFEWGRKPLFAREDDRITFMGAGIVAAIASVAALAGFVALEGRTRSLAAENVLAALTYRIEQFQELIDMRERGARIAATRPAVLHNLREIRAGRDDGSNLANVRAVVDSFLKQGFRAVAYRDAEGRVIAGGGAFAAAAALAVPLATPDKAELLWDEGFVIRNTLALRDEAGRVGDVVTEQPLPVLTRLIRNTPGMGRTGDMGLCVLRGERLLCFPQRLNPRVFSTPLASASGTLLPMTKALRGRSGVEITRDYRGQNVVAAYAPIGALGPGMVVKIDAAEVFEPVREPLWVLVVVLVLLSGAGALLLRLQVRPLVTKLVDAEARARVQGDIALRASEAALRRAHLMARVAHVVTGHDGQFESWSESLPAMIGVAPDAMPRSTREWLDLVHPDDRETFRSRALEAARRGSRMNFDYRLRRSDGQWIHLRQAAEPLDAERGAARRWFSTLQDVTEQARAEDEVRRLNQELEERVAKRTAELEMSNRELEAFSYSVSHDLRAPVRAIEGFSGLLEREHRENLSAEAQRLLGRVRHNAELMAHLIDDLLAFSRMARQPVTRKPTALAPMVRTCLEEMRDEIATRKIDVRVGDLPTIAADPALISVVLHNLIGNALKYTRPKRDPQIEIGMAWHEGEPAVYIRDNGVGFDMQYAGKLFGVFQRLHPSTQFEGTGVGLAMVQRIVQRHGGRVWAEAKPNEGATFYFTLGADPS